MALGGIMMKAVMEAGAVIIGVGAPVVVTGQDGPACPTVLLGAAGVGGTTGSRITTTSSSSKATTTTIACSLSAAASGYEAGEIHGAAAVPHARMRVAREHPSSRGATDTRAPAADAASGLPTATTATTCR